MLSENTHKWMCSSGSVYCKRNQLENSFIITYLQLFRFFGLMTALLFSLSLPHSILAKLSYHHFYFLSTVVLKKSVLPPTKMKKIQNKTKPKGFFLSARCCQLPKQACRCDEHYKYDGWDMWCRWPHNTCQRISEEQVLRRFMTPQHEISPLSHTDVPPSQDLSPGLLNPLAPLPQIACVKQCNEIYNDMQFSYAREALCDYSFSASQEYSSVFHYDLNLQHLWHTVI